MKLDALTTAHIYAIIREDITALESRHESASEAMDYELEEKTYKRLEVMRNNLSEVAKELAKFVRKEDYE